MSTKRSHILKQTCSCCYLFVYRYSQGKTVFTQFATRIYWHKSLPVSTLFHIFTQSIKFHAFHCHELTHFILNVFNNLILKQILWKTKTFFKKLEYHFLVESTETENSTVSYKTALSEVNIKTDRKGTTKLTYNKERSFQ